jgi:hypothetical protein
VQDKILVLHKVDTLNNLAYCLTKALSREQVEQARAYMFGTKTLMSMYAYVQCWKIHGHYDPSTCDICIALHASIILLEPPALCGR